VLGELLGVAPLKLGPLVGIVGEPLAERGARRHVLVPVVQPQVDLANAAGPEPLDQDADAVGLGLGFVHALE